MILVINCFGFNIFRIYLYKDICVDFRVLICCKQGEIVYGTNFNYAYAKKIVEKTCVYACIDGSY